MKRINRLIAVALTAAILLSALPPQALAYYASAGERPQTIVDSSGKAISVTEDWETTFPYGTFAFARSEASAEEGGEAAVIQVYRLGGTKGRATAYLSYMPAAAEMSPGVMSYANAAGANDIEIEVEDTLPIAQYQRVGRPADPERSDKLLADDPYTGEDALENDRVLSLDAAGASYQWYLHNGSKWVAVNGATEAAFVVSAEDYAQYDFRCVYTLGDTSYCTDSAKGIAYEKPEEEPLPPMPDDLDLNPEQTFTRLEMDPEDPYLGYVFSMTFAEDEWVKEIRVTVPEDDVAEAIKGGYFTIVDCEGGSLYDTANTLALGVYDNDRPDPCELGFAVTEVEADRSEGTALVTVRRTGGTQNVLTIAYTTEDGTAKAGRDYIASSGRLAFYGDVTEQTIEIPLIDDGVETEARLSLGVVLSDLLGDSDGICSLTHTRATVDLYNTASGEQDNLATMLYDGEAVDVSGALDQVSGTPIRTETVTGVQNAEPPSFEAIISGYDGADLSPQTYEYGTISFARSSYPDYNNNYWRDWTYVANTTTFYGGEVNTVGGFTGSSWTAGYREGGGWILKGKSPAEARLSIPNMASMYSGYRGDYKYKVGIKNSDLYGAEFVYPWASTVKAGALRDYIASKVTWDWGLFSGYTYTYTTRGYIDTSWTMDEDMHGLRIGLSRHDAHNADKDDASCILEMGALRRRAFSRDMKLRIHTANDGESGGGNVVTAPAGAAALASNSGVYAAMKPTVSLAQRNGGVQTYGGLYVGSTLQVELKNTPSYDPYTGDKLGAAVYLTKSNGAVVATGVKEAGTNRYNLTLYWSGMRESDLNDTYTVNVVMTRVQNFKLDFSPSVERKTDDSGNPLAEIDSTKIPAAWDRFWSSAANTSANHVTIGYSAPTATAPHFTRTSSYENLTKSSSGWSGATSNPFRELKNKENIQCVNFNRSPEDRILYNGRIYAGNETIWLDVADLALENATFRYYHKDYLSATSIMTADISSVGLYLDVDGNGRIDGHFDESIGYFVLDSGTEDMFVMFLENGKDYDESLFAPVAVAWDENGTPTRYAQYFTKVFYTMTPRALTPEAGHENDKAQVLPAFVTNVTDPDAYAQLTREQRAYRYLISGKNRTKDTEYVRSADGHLMYGALAAKPQIIDVPLGGDIDPPKIVTGKDDFTWTPKYQGNLLYPFSDPEPIYIAHSLAGDNISIAGDFTVNGDGSFTLTSDAKAKLNGYLGSFAGNSTFALCIQRQEKTTDEIAAANGVSSGDKINGGSELALQGTALSPAPESATLTARGTFPNSDYLKSMSSGGDTAEPKMDMEESDSDFEEFNVDLGVKLPTADIGVTDYVSVIMDGYEVGFSIGIPLGGYNSNGDAGSGGVGQGGGGGGGGGGGQGQGGGGGGQSSGSNWVSPKAANAAKAEDMGKLRDFLKDPTAKNMAATDDSMTNALNGSEMASSGFKVECSVSVAFLFKYNSVDNDYYFSQFAISLSAALEYTYQQRLTPCPVVYIYVKVGFSLELSTGATVERETVETDTPYIGSSPKKLAKGQTTVMATGCKSFNITFKGKVALELYEDAACTRKVTKSVSGYLTSDGGDPITATMIKKDGYGFGEHNDLTYYVKITALEQTEITRLAEIVRMETKSYWSGFQLSPEGFIEAGVGVGVEIMKLEIFIKISLGCAMTFGAWNAEKEEYDPFFFEEFSFGLSLGLRVVLLVFTFEMDMIAYSIQYEGKQGGKGKWTHSWSALGGLFGDEIGTLSATDSGGNLYGVTIRLPGNAGKTQEIYSGGNGAELSPLAFNANDEKVPFQLSGYGSSGDAFKLTDGLIAGHGYQVVSVGQDNYLVYTISRTNVEHAVDGTMLVLSRLRLTSVEGTDSYGLVNPINPAYSPSYIILDDDGTGDLDFNVWADGTTIHAAWVSYATRGEPSQVKAKPEDSVRKPVKDGAEMDENNYVTFVRPDEPVVVENPGATRPPEPSLPATADYFVTVDAFNALADLDKARYSPDPITAPEYYYVTSYGSYDAARTAYETSSAYTDYQAAKLAYDNYDANKARYNAYLNELADYQDFNAWYEYFKSLTDHADSVQAIAAAAARNTVVKKASFHTETPADGFTSPQIASGMEDATTPTTGSLVYLPEGEGDGSVTIYAKADHMEGAEKTAAVNGYTAYLTNAGYDPTAANGDSAKRQIGSYRLAYQSSLWDTYGKGSSVCVTADDVSAISELKLAQGQILDNFEVTKIGDLYYLAYTTSETQYVDAESKKTDAAGAEDLLTIKRLFLRTFKVEGGAVVWTNHGTETEDAQKGLLLRTLYDYDIGVGSNKDGIYKGAATTAYSDPYFANLQFLRGALGDSLTGTPEDFELMSAGAQEDFLLFEMNGETFVIRQGSLESITASRSGSIIPFFSYQPNEDAKKAQATGRAQVTIGADGAGGISAVYVAPVPGTGNNALYLSKYDPTTATWGAGTMLAMGYMDVYEDSVSQGWSPDETGKAYLDPAKGGGMDQFVFSGLQVAMGQKSAAGRGLGTLSETDTVSSMSRAETLALLGMDAELSPLSAGGEVDLTGQLTPAQLDLLGEAGAAVGSQDTLLVITQGTTTYLKERKYQDAADGNKEKTLVVPMSESEAQAKHNQYVSAGSPLANRKPGVGMYAISYGVGGQAIGQGQLTFATYDFSAGARLRANVSFINTGDVGIRGSTQENQGITAELIASGGGMTSSLTLASWTITSNIVPGQRTELAGDFTLAQTLPEGTDLSLRVTEGDHYKESGGVPFSASVDLLKVEKKPELGFETMTIKPTGIDASGRTILTVDILAGNRGTLTAEDVFVQFSYDGGTTDAEGRPVYEPLDLSVNTLAVSEQEVLTPLSGVTANDLPNGIFYLHNSRDGDDIMPGYGRRLQGTVTVPADFYKGAQTGSLNLRVELFSKADNTTGWTAGIVEAVHGEYNTGDNVREVQIEHATFFHVASKVTLPMGNTMRLPVAVSATTGSTVPVILAEEFAAPGENKHLGILNYRAGTYVSGADPGGTLILAPVSTGSGIIRLMDINTNSYFDVAYTVTEAATGINIFRDNEMFAFKNKNGTLYDPADPAGSQDWQFASAVDAWGADNTAPYLGNLARGKVGASFTFTTQAQSIDLVFNGTARVESTFPGFTARTVSALGGDGTGSGEFASVSFGKNETNYAHTVTITVTGAAGTGQYADFDRLIERYGTGAPPKPAEDAASPHIYWSRSFPDTASLDGSAPVALSAYILDGGALASVTVNGQNREGLTKHADGFWEVPLSISGNGTLNVAAFDTAGNRTAHNVTVDWFNVPPTTGASAAIPALTAKLVNQNGEELTDDMPFSSGDTAYIQAKDVPDGATLSVAYLNVSAQTGDLTETGVTAGEGGRYPVSSNGWYLVTAKNPSLDERQWTTRLITMSRIDTAIPVVTLTRAMDPQTETDTPVLDWTVRKDTAGSTVKNTIKQVTINGKAMDITTGLTALSGSFAVTHGGLYRAEALDTAGLTGLGEYTLQNIPVRLADGRTAADLYSVTNARKDGGSKANGSVALMDDILTVLVGGTYDAARSAPASNSYVGSYEWTLAAGDTPATGEALTDLLDGDGWSTDKTLTGLEPGKYVLYIRDAQDRRNTVTAAAFPLTVGDESLALALTARADGESGKTGLNWSADKGAGALVAIESVTLNGCPLTGESTFSAAGSFPLTHAGTYTLTATDGTSTETVSVTLKSEEVPITVGGGALTIKTDNPLNDSEDSIKALATVRNPWNLDNNNGVLTVDLSTVVGGTYDAARSIPAGNAYAGSYEWQLRRLGDFDESHVLAQLKSDWLKGHPGVKEEDIPAEALAELGAEVARRKAAADAGEAVEDWNTGSRAEGLGSGRYELMIRDALYPDNDNLLKVGLVLDSEYIRVESQSKNASSYSAVDGEITVAASGGYGLGGTYQFILRPITEETALVTDLSQMTSAVDPVRFPDWAGSAWQTADPQGGRANTGLFAQLQTGWYQVAVRPMVGAAAEEMEELFARYDVSAAAGTALAAAEKAGTPAAIASDAAARKAALETARQAWLRAADGAEKDAAWGNYAALADNDSTVLDALNAWKNADFADGDLKTAYYAAADRHMDDKAAAAAGARLSDAQADFSAKQAAYEALRSALEAATDAAYTASPSIWDNAATAAVLVNYDPYSDTGKINPSDLAYPNEDTVEVTYSNRKRTLSTSTMTRLIADNAKRDILAKSSVMQVLIPAGTLSGGDNLEQMLMPFASLPEDPENWVVWRTDSGGAAVPVAWSLVTGEGVSYIASRPGAYTLGAAKAEFGDVPAAFWGHDEIAFAAARGLFTGVGRDRFDPDGAMTRAMFVTVLGRMANVDAAAYGERAFSDVEPGAWYGPYVAWAAEEGFVNGTGSGAFAPDAPVTREQVCAILDRYLNGVGLALPQSGTTAAFQDAADISPWAKDTIDRFQSAGIVKGSQGRFLPGSGAGRAEGASIFARLIRAVLGNLGK